MSMVEKKKTLNTSNNAIDETDSNEVSIPINKGLDDSFNPYIEPIPGTNKLCTIIDTCSLTSAINHVEQNDETQGLQKFSVSVINNIQDTITDSNISSDISGQIMDTDTQNDNNDHSKNLTSEIIKDNLKSGENSSELTITDSNEISKQTMDTDTQNENKDCSKNLCSENINDNFKSVENSSDFVKNEIVHEITDNVIEANDSNVETSVVRFYFFYLTFLTKKFLFLFFS
jgi:hypothetical protein